MALAGALLRGVSRTRSLLATSAICSNRSSSTDVNGKIYEMRRYVVKPDKYTEFVSHARENYEELMMPHGKLLGYWTASLGSLNEVFHLWEYGKNKRMR